MKCGENGMTAMFMYSAIHFISLTTAKFAIKSASLLTVEKRNEFQAFNLNLLIANTTKTLRQLQFMKIDT